MNHNINKTIHHNCKKKKKRMKAMFTEDVLCCQMQGFGLGTIVQDFSCSFT